MSNRTEFWSPSGLVAAIDGIMAPRVGELISIRKVTYRVASVGWAVDNADDRATCAGRCNVELEPTQ